MDNHHAFGKMRRIIFPIYKNELRKLIPINVIFLIIAFNYALLRTLKDTFIIHHTSVVVISSLKLFCVMPSILLLTICYNKLSRVLDRDGRFNAVVGYFFVFFVFAFLFFIPNLKALQLDKLANQLHVQFPKLFGVWEIIRYWPLTLFYIHAEAWGTLVLGVLLWTFVNEITGLKQAQRLYSFLTLGAAIGTILAGSIIKIFNNATHLLGVVVVAISLLLVIYNLFTFNIKKNPAYYQIILQPKKQKMKLSFLASFKMLVQSKPLIYLAIIVIAYGTTVNLFEIVWKDKIRALKEASGIGAVADIFGNQHILGGITNIILIFLVSSSIMRKGWRFAASVTPVVTLIMTLLFFTFFYFNHTFTGLARVWDVPFPYITVLFGMINVILIKAFKYTLFDPTKEAIYIPLDEEYRVRGKAAVDGVGSRLGKSLGSMIVVFSSSMLGGVDIAGIRYILFFIMLCVIIAWLIAIKRLSIHKKVAETLRASRSSEVVP